MRDYLDMKYRAKITIKIDYKPYIFKNAYTAFLALRLPNMAHILSHASLKEAEIISKENKYRPLWPKVAISSMEYVLYQKFTQNPYLLYRFLKEDPYILNKRLYGPIFVKVQNRLKKERDLPTVKIDKTLEKLENKKEDEEILKLINQLTSL